MLGQRRRSRKPGLLTHLQLQFCYALHARCERFPSEHICAPSFHQRILLPPVLLVTYAESYLDFERTARRLVIVEAPPSEDPCGM